jgi:hypothetical protein
MQFVFETLFEVVFQSTGNLIIRILTAGQVKTTPVFKKPFESERLLGGRSADGKLVCGAMPAMIVGLIFWAVLLIAVLAR